MQKSHVVALLRQISSSLPGDTEKIPDEIADLSLAQIYLLGELFQLERTGRESLSLSALSRENGFSKATRLCDAEKAAERRIRPDADGRRG